MRVVEFTDGPYVFVSQEQQELLETISNQKRVYKSQLDERQILIADQLVVSDILKRKTDESKKIFYELSKKIS